MANKKIKGLTVEIGGDSTKLGKALDESKKKSKSLQTELKQVDKLLKLDPTNVELMGQKQKILGEQVEETKKRLSLLRDEQSKVNELFSSGEIGEEEYRGYQREVEQTRIELEKLETQYSEAMQSVNGVDLSTAKGKVGNFKDSITDLSDTSKAKMDELANNLNTVGNKIESVGTTISTTVSSAATKVLSNSVEAFEDLDNGYDIIVKKTGATDDKLESLKRTANEVFSNSTFDMTTIGNAIGEVNTRFGYTDEQLRSVSEQYLQFAKINDTDVSDSVSKSSRIMQAWNISAENLPDLLGMITAKGQETGVSVSSLMDKVLTNNSTFKEMGLTLEESISLMAQFEKNGVNDSTALMAMKTAVKNAAREGKSLSEALSENVNDIKNASSETEALQKATALFGSRGAAEMANAIREGRIDFDNLSGSMSSYKNTVETTYKATVDPLEKSKKVINNLKLAGVELAETALKEGEPLIEDVIDGVKTVTNWLKKLTPEQKKTLTKAIEIMAVVGPGVTVVGKLTKGIGNVVSILPKATSLIKGLGTAMSSNPVGAWTAAITLAVTAIAALTAAVNEYSNLKWESTESSKFAAEVDKAADALESSAKKITETTQNTFDSIGESIKNNDLIDTYQSELDELLGKQNLTDEEKSKLDLIVKYLTDNVDGFSDAWSKYTIKDKETGEITLVEDLETVRKALNDTIDEFQKNSYISLMEKAYSDSLSENLSASTERNKSRASLEAEEKQFNKRLSELGISEEDFKEAYNQYGEIKPWNMQTIGLKTGLTYDEYNELEKTYSSIKKYRSAVSKLNQELRESDELQQDSLDVISVLNGNYDDASAVLMAYRLNMISLEDVTRNGWSSIEELEKSAAETGKNTVYGVGQDMTDYEEKVYSSTDEMTKDFVDRLSVNKNAAKDTVEGTTKAVDDEAPKLRKSMGSAGELARDEFVINMENGAHDAKGAGKKLADNAVEGAESADTETSGKNFVSGFIDGLKDGTLLDNLWNSAKDIASTALNSIKSFLGIASPSKEAAKLGKFTAQGFAEGLESGDAEALKKAEELAETARKALGGNLDLLDINAAYAPSQTQILTDYSVTHTHDFQQSSEIRALRNDIGTLSANIRELADRPIDVYVDKNKLVGGTIGEIDRQLASVEFFKNRGG